MKHLTILVLLLLGYASQTHASIVTGNDKKFDLKMEELSAVKWSKDTISNPNLGRGFALGSCSVFELANAKGAILRIFIQKFGGLVTRALLVKVIDGEILTREWCVFMGNNQEVVVRCEDTKTLRLRNVCLKNTQHLPSFVRDFFGYVPIIEEEN